MRLPPGAHPPCRAGPSRPYSDDTITDERERAGPSRPYPADDTIRDEAINSEDEYDGQLSGTPDQERLFAESLVRRGLHIREMKKDGNCLFRCISDRVYGDAEMHDVARRLCMDHMEKERDHFSQYVTQDFDAYLRRKRRDGTFGNHIEMQALSEIYSRPIEVFAQSEQPINTFQSAQEPASDDSPPLPPLRLSYHGRNHYNVIFDPEQPDVGVGLGLPGLQPGEADRNQIRTATRESEEAALEHELLAAAQSSSELAATQDAIEEAVMRASRDEYLRSNNGMADVYSSMYAGLAAEGDAASAKRSKPTSEAWDPAASQPPAWEGQAGGAEPPHPEANATVQQLLAMGFPLARALHAHEMFGDNLENCLEVLTTD